MLDHASGVQSGAVPLTQPTDWDLAEDFLRRHPTRWGALNWIAARPLIASVNDLLSGHAGELITDLRNHYVDRSANPGLVINRPDVSSFVVIGDTGEADPSQYVVAPALSRVVRDSGAGFVIVASDVIYPSGDVNDYVDGFYAPYRSTDSDHFSVWAPLLGQPGNHDWYDGLYGFMYHFCAGEKPPDELYAPRGFAPIQRLARILWRRPSTASKAAAAARQATPAVGPAMAQPGPYFAVKTRDLLVVSIDTGISGGIDPRQMAWLMNLSRQERGPKLLVTGSPLLVNANLKKCAVEPPTPGLPASVWDLVNDPAHNYVATVGGDVHNFQRYSAAAPVRGVPQVHLVNGGGGAFMHALHPFALSVNDPRLDPAEPHPYPDLTFPTPEESFSFFSRQLIPSLWRILRTLAVFLLGVLTTAAVGALAGGGEDAAGVVRGLGLAAGAGFLALVAVRMALPALSRSSALKRALVPIGGYALGVGAAAVGHGLDPERFPAFLAMWLALTAFHVALGWGISRTGWWLPDVDHPAEREVGPLGFYLGLGLACLVALALQLVAFRGLPAAVVAVASVLFLFGLGLLGRVLRRRPGAARWWRSWGTLTAVTGQMVFFAAVVGQLAAAEGLTAVFWGGLLGVVVLAGVVLLTAALLVGLVELCVLPFRIGRGTARRAWGRVAAVVHQVPIPLLWLAIVAWCLLASGPVTEAAAALPIVVASVVSVVLFTDLLRRFLPRGYGWVVLGSSIAAAVLILLIGGRFVAAGLAGAVILLAVLVSVVLAHLVFLGAHGVIFDFAAHRGRIDFTPAELAEIFAAKTQRPRPRVPNVSPRTRRLARLTYPGLGEPGGPLQTGVAEIYSTDDPPFFKGFLAFRSTADRLQVTLHKVFGDRPGEQQMVADVRLR